MQHYAMLISLCVVCSRERWGRRVVVAPQALLEIQAYKDPLAYPGRARTDRT